MTLFPVLTAATAPAGAQELFVQVKADHGRILNLHGVLAASPELLSGYLALAKLVRQSSLTPTEQQVVMITANYEHYCGYCMAGHTAAAIRQGVAGDIVARLRAGKPLSDEKLEVLRRFTRAVLLGRGQVTADDLAAFFAAGYQPRQIFEVILAIGAKVLSNYANHFADTPLDSHMQELAWEHPLATQVPGSGKDE